MQKHTFDGIAGLYVYTDYFAQEQCKLLVCESLELYARLEAAISQQANLEQARIPQPYFVRSAQHNLPSEEYYARVALDEANSRKVRCEYFPRYGEDGHALCYFRGTLNVPDFVTESLLQMIRRTVEEDGLAAAGQELTWKLTMNIYKSVRGTVAGFPFHVDIPANGVVTMILNIQKEVLFQITRGGALSDIPLPVGSLLLLSGESRYEWKHRVLPTASSGLPGPDGVERVSLVLGFQ